MRMLRPEKRNPAAPELLGSKDTGGAEHFDRQAEDQEDKPSFGFNQLFLARWITRHFGLPPHRAATEHITTPRFRNSATCTSDAADLRFKQNLGKLYPFRP